MSEEVVTRKTILATFTGISPRYNRSFIRGAHEYATTGRIVVRLPRESIDDEAALLFAAPAAELVFERNNWDGPYTSAPDLDFPARSRTECRQCDGVGTRHSCPSCECTCDECDGVGSLDDDEGKSIEVYGVPINLAVARRTWALTRLNLRLGPPPKPGGNWTFLFNGGEGVFATRTAPAETHLHLEAA